MATRAAARVLWTRMLVGSALVVVSACASSPTAPGAAARPATEGSTVAGPGDRGSGTSSSSSSSTTSTSTSSSSTTSTTSPAHLVAAPDACPTLDRDTGVAPDQDPTRFFVPAAVEPGAPLAGSKLFFRHIVPPIDARVRFEPSTDLVVVEDELVNEVGHLDRATARFTPIAVFSRCEIRRVVQQGQLLLVSLIARDVDVVAAIDVATGQERWRQALDDEVVWMAGDGANLHLALRTGRRHVLSVATFEEATGRVLHAGNATDEPAGPVLAADRGLWVSASGDDGPLVCFHLDPDTGETLGRIEVPKDVAAPPVVSAGALWVLRDSGAAEAYDAASGAPLLSDPLPAGAVVDVGESPSITATSSAVRVSTTSHADARTTIRTYDPSTRRRRSTMQVTPDALAMNHAFHDSPPVFVEVMDGLLYARSFNRGGQVEMQWLEAPPA